MMAGKLVFVLGERPGAWLPPVIVIRAGSWVYFRIGAVLIGIPPAHANIGDIIMRAKYSPIFFVILATILTLKRSYGVG